MYVCSYYVLYTYVCSYCADVHFHVFCTDHLFEVRFNQPAYTVSERAKSVTVGVTAERLRKGEVPYKEVILSLDCSSETLEGVWPTGQVYSVMTANPHPHRRSVRLQCCTPNAH